MEELEVIVQRMIDAGESEQNIKTVIQEYNAGKTNGAAAKGATATPETGQAPESSDLGLEDSSSGLNIEDFLITGLEEIMHKEICPHNFFITGWGWNNFIKDYIKKSDLNKRDLKFLQKPNIIELDPSLYEIPWNEKVTTNIISLAKIIPSIL